MKRYVIAVLILINLILLPGVTPAKADASLSLVYTMAGHEYQYFIPEAYYAAPVTVDLNGDGRLEIVYGNYSLYVVDAATGQLVWRVNGGRDKTYGYASGNDVGTLWDLEVRDIDADGKYEIITGHKGGIVSVLNSDGYFKPGWPQQLAGEYGVVKAAARSIEVSDIDNDGKCEIIVGAAADSSQSVWLYDYRGNIMKGWPQLASYQDAGKAGLDKIWTGFSYGIFMDGVTAGDIDGDGIKEILAATDTGFLCIYTKDGKLYPANQQIFKGRTWGRVGLWESMDIEQDTSKGANEGWGGVITGRETREERYKGELGHAVVRVCDLNNDGKNEIITSAVILDRANDRNNTNGDYNASRYMTVFIFNSDRTRFAGWEVVPSDENNMGAPLKQEAGTLAMGVQAEPVIEDLDGDGVKEIIINTYDGCIHAFSVNDSLHEFGNFPFRIPGSGSDPEAASGVVCRDLNGDGKKELIFTTFTDCGKPGQTTGKIGSLYILHYEGTEIVSTRLPEGYPKYETGRPVYVNGSLAKPAVADVDGDGLFEIAVNTRYRGLCLYKARIDYGAPALQKKEYNDNITVKVSGGNVKFDQAPIVYNNRTMVPMRKIFESIGATVTWDDSTKTAIGRRGDRTVKITIGSSKMYLNNKLIQIDSPAMIKSGRTLVPVRAIAEGLGCDVDWDKNSKTVYIEPKEFKWSEWSTSRPRVDEDLYYVEKKEQYRIRTREKEYYTLDYYAGNRNFVKERVSYGSWSGWTRDSISENDNREVETRRNSEPVRYHYAHYCTGYISDGSNRYMTAGYKFHSDCLYHDLGWYDHELSHHPDGTGYVIYNSDGSFYRCSNTCFRWYIIETEGGDYTEYRSRPVYHSYTYWNWSDWSYWSEWQDNFTNRMWNTEYYDVDERTVYRYKEK